MNHKTALLLFNVFLLIVFILLLILIVDFIVFLTVYPVHQLVIFSFFLTFFILCGALPLFALSLRKKVLWEHGRSETFWSTYSSFLKNEIRIVCLFVSFSCSTFEISFVFPKMNLNMIVVSFCIGVGY
jgi:hypothetical protein